MFGMGFGEILLVGMVVLVVLGPERIPDVARTLGKALREVRQATNMLREAVMIEENLGTRRSSSPAERPAVGSHSKAITMAEVEAYREVQPVPLTAAKPCQDTREVAIKPASEKAQRRYVHLHKPFEETL
jgi:Tat protein translocase TatB subunit